MKTVVVYKSETGFAKKYAEWIAEALAADIFEVSTISIDDLLAYDAVIYGGGVYAVGINGVKYIRKNISRLTGKKIVIFATGVSPASKNVIKMVRDKNFTADEQKQIEFFYLRGGFDYSKLNRLNQVIMTLLKWRLQMKKALTADERGLLASYDKPVDCTSRQNIDEIIAYVNESS